MRSEERGLVDLRVALFQTRHAESLSMLVGKYGGEPLSAEVMREVELASNPDAAEFARRLQSGHLDALVVLTGVGQRRLASQLEDAFPGSALAAALEPLVVAARGPKALRALRERAIRCDVVAPEPFTWEGLLASLATHTPLAGKRVALQLYGTEHPRMVAGLEAHGAEVWPLWVYRWELPEDLAPARSLIDRILAGELQMALFTSAPQVSHLLRIAELDDRRAALHAALRKLPLGSVGPSCTEGMRALDLEPAFEPEHGKMGHLVREASHWAAANLP